jgi:hypothetical protein
MNKKVTPQTKEVISDEKSEPITWDDVFNKLEKKLEIYLPIRAKNFIRNKYNPPIEK